MKVIFYFLQTQKKLLLIIFFYANFVIESVLSVIHYLLLLEFLLTMLLFLLFVIIIPIITNWSLRSGGCWSWPGCRWCHPSVNKRLEARVKTGSRWRWWQWWWWCLCVFRHGLFSRLRITRFLNAFIPFGFITWWCSIRKVTSVYIRIPNSSCWTVEPINAKIPPFADASVKSGTICGVPEETFTLADIVFYGNTKNYIFLNLHQILLKVVFNARKKSA